MDDWSDVLVAVLKFVIRYPEIARFLAAKVGFPVMRHLVWSVAVLVRNDKHTLDTDEWVDHLFGGEQEEGEEPGHSPEEFWNMSMDDRQEHVAAAQTVGNQPEDRTEALQTSVEQVAGRKRVHPLDGPSQPV